MINLMEDPAPKFAYAEPRKEAIRQGLAKRINLEGLRLEIIAHSDRFEAILGDGYYFASMQIQLDWQNYSTDYLNFVATTLVHLYARQRFLKFR